MLLVAAAYDDDDDDDDDVPYQQADPLVREEYQSNVVFCFM